MENSGMPCVLIACGLKSNMERSIETNEGCYSWSSSIKTINKISKARSR